MRLFDLTEKIQLDSDSRRQYDIARLVLHVIFFLTMLFVMYRILFPIVPLDFDMNSPTAIRNNISSPRIELTNDFPAKKMIQTNDTLLFNANPIGKFSETTISLTLEKGSSDIQDTPVKIRKSYQSFFYPTGKQVGFKDSTLLFTSNGNYYMISNGALRKFADTNIILAMGYPKSAFLEVTVDDLKLNKPGPDIIDANIYPDDTLFAIDDTYYQIKNQSLIPFVSATAFLTQFDSALAISKNTDFLSNYPESETYAGFADGTLASFADAVFILSAGKSYPIENEVTFAAMGFDWNNVIPVTSSELGAYKKQKQFTNNSPHPDGTIFLDQDSNKLFIIKDKQKLSIENKAVLGTYSKQKPIIANSKDAQKEYSCNLKKSFFDSSTYKCNIPLEKFASLIGNDFEVSTFFKGNVTMNHINATFSTPLAWDSFMNSLSIIKKRLNKNNL